MNKRFAIRVITHLVWMAVSIFCCAMICGSIVTGGSEWKFFIQKTPVYELLFISAALLVAAGLIFLLNVTPLASIVKETLQQVKAEVKGFGKDDQ